MTDGVHVRLTLTRGLKYTSGLDPRINTAGSTLIILAEHKPPVYDKRGIRLITARHRRPLADVLDQRIHSCNQLTSILAKLEANAAGADDALMLDTRGFVAETNATHVFVVASGELHTPPTAACPEGITRQAVIDLCAASGIACTVRDIEPGEVFRADEMFCTGTMGEIAPVTEVDGRPIGPGTRGPVTARIAQLFADLVEREAEPLR
jgi:branched-chain amino acid aminotransferase